MIPLAHAGGWDEALLVLGIPILGFIVIRAMERRARTAAADADVAPSADDPLDGPASDDEDG